MAFMTMANLAKLCRKLELKKDVDKETFLKNVINNLEVYKILNKVQRNFLFKYAMILKDEVDFETNHYQFVPERIDTRTLVNEKAGKIKYHLDHSCDLILSDYYDFYIPEQIRKLGGDGIIEYRDWFKKNRFTEKYKDGIITKDVIIMAFNLKYPKMYNIDSIGNGSNLLFIERPNTTIESLEKDFDMDAFRKAMGIQLNKWQSNFNCKVSITLAKHAYLLFKPIEVIEATIEHLFSPYFIRSMGGIEKLKAVFTLANSISKSITQLVLNYLKWNYNLSEKYFNEITLDNFGLECCQKCKEKEQFKNKSEMMVTYL